MVLSSRNLDWMILIFCIAMGLILISISSITFNKMDDKCTKRLIRTGMTIIMTLGAVMVTIPVTYLACQFAFDCEEAR